LDIPFSRVNSYEGRINIVLACLHRYLSEHETKLGNNCSVFALISRIRAYIWEKETEQSVLCISILGMMLTFLRSTGYMCVKGWKIDRFNPAKIPVITHEMDHEPEFLDLRGGPKTAGKMLDFS